MEAEDILWVLLYAILAAVLYAIYWWKTSRVRSLLGKSQSLIAVGNLRKGVHLLKEALWKTNENPDLEQSILDELAKAYQARGVSFDSQDYILLIGQFRELSKKGSTKAIEEMKKVQKLKRKIIDRMPDVS